MGAAKLGGHPPLADPDRHSSPIARRRRASLPIRVVEESAPLEDGVIFVAPPNRLVELVDGQLRLRPATPGSVRALDRPPARVGADFLAFLRRIERVYPDHDLHVILDNVSTHKTPDVRAWLERHPRITLPRHPDLGARPFAGAASGA